MAIIAAGSVAFDAVTDVVVVGAGACGFTAALAAADAGAEVMLLERDERPHGSTGMSQGNICAAGTKLQRAHGIEDDAERFFRDIMAKTKGQTDPGLARLVAEQSGPTIDWLIDAHDIALEINPGWAEFGHSRPRLHGPPGKTGLDLLGSLDRAAETAGVLSSTGAHVVDLYAAADGEVSGVGLRRRDGTRETIGCRALVLATCGFGANHGMVAHHIPHMGAAPYFGHEGNVGDGILWGQALGAAVADMAAYQGHGALSEHGIALNYDVVIKGGFCVNLAGRRFSHELADISGQAEKVLSQPDNTAWVVFGEGQRQSVIGLPEYEDLVRLGAVREGATIAELASSIGIDPVALTGTFREVENCARSGEPDAFGRCFRSDEPLFGPYRAVKVRGALFHTQGGLVVDDTARVRRKDGSLLPNLFAGGGAARGISGPGVWGYLPAAGLCMAVTLGRLAGTHAAAVARENINHIVTG